MHSCYAQLLLQLWPQLSKRGFTVPYYLNKLVSYALFYRALPCERFIGACGSLNVLSHAAKLTCQLHPSYHLQLTWEEAESIRLAGTRTANSIVK